MSEIPTSAISEVQAGAIARTGKKVSMANGKVCRFPAVLALVLVCPAIIAADDFTTWSHASPVVLNTSPAGANVMGTVLNFPVLVRLNPANFQFFSQTLPGGADIRFAKSDGTHLQYQIERWVDVAGDNDTAEIWVKIDTVYGNNAAQHIVMLWGKVGSVDSSNSAAVFDTANGFVGVWHLGGNLSDATNNNYSGTDAGTVDTAAGLVGRARAFNGSSQYFHVGDLPDRASGTVSCWFRPGISFNASSATSQGIWGKRETDSLNASLCLRGIDYILGDGSAGNLQTKIENNNASAFLAGSTSSFTSGTWYHVSWSWGNNADTIYVNGVLEGTGAASQTIAGAANDEIGRSTYDIANISGGGPLYFNGTIDEMHIEKTTRNANWVRLSCENQKFSQSLVVLPQYLTWDISNAAGIQTGSGTWGVDNYWTKEGTVLQAWPGAGNYAKFAGADGSYAINVSGTQSVDGIDFGNNGYTLTGGSSVILGHTGGVSVASGVSATIMSPLGGTAGLTVAGGGILTLSGVNTYTGPTGITAGSLLVTGSIAAGSAVTISNGATLGGTGTVLGAVSSDGIIAPGISGSGKLTVGDLTLGSGSSLNFELGTLSDSIVVNNNLTLEGALDITAASGFGAGVYTIATYAGTLTDNVLIVGSAPGGYSYSISATGGYVTLTVAPLAARQWVGGGGNNFWNTAANWMGSTVPIASDSVIFGSSVYPCSLDVNVSVRCLMFTSGFTQTFYTNGKVLTIGRMLDMNMPGSMFCNGNDTIRFGGSESKEFRPKAGTYFPTIHQAGSGSTVVAGNYFKAGNLHVTGGTLNLGSGMNDTVSGTVLVNGGTIDFASCTLSVQGDIDLSNAAGIVHSGGWLGFIAASAQNFYPAYEVRHPRMFQNGTGILTIRKNRLNVGRFNINNGQVVMDTSLLADTVYAMSGTTFKLDTVETNVDTIRSLEGNGSLDFGKTKLHVSSALHLNMFGAVAGLGRLVFFGPETFMFEPRYGFYHDRIEKTGAGTVQVSMYSLKAGKLFVNNGVWDWFTAGNDTVSDTVRINGGSMTLYGATVHARTIAGSGGNINFNHGVLNIYGAGGSADFSGLSAIGPDTGILRFSGDGTSIQHFMPSATLVCPGVEIQGVTGDTVALNGPLRAKALRQYGGALKWGNGFSHQVDTLRTTGGSMNFGSSTILVTASDADLSGLTAVSSTTATLSFSGVAGTQYLTPPSALSLPAIHKEGGGILMVSAYPMICKGLSVTGGTFDFGGRNLTVNGNVSIANGNASTMAGLSGITVSVNGGNVSFSGQAGNLLNLAPASPWFLNVTGGGTLQATYASIGNCDASGSSVSGSAFSTCMDASGNTNWTFLPPDTDPPSGGSVAIADNNGYTSDADPRLTITVTGADSMRIGLSTDTASAAWKLYSSIDSITISSGGDGLKSVFVQFRDLAGNRSIWATGSTTYDATAPTGGSVVISDNGGYTSDADPRLTIGAAGADSMRIGLSTDTASAPWKLYSSIDSITISSGGDGLKSVFVQFRDRAGNRGIWATGSTTYDATAPTGSIVVIDNAGATADSDPRLSLVATDAAQMRICLAVDTSTAAWKTFASMDSVNVSSGGSGMKHLRAQFRDHAGNRSPWTADSTLFDTVPPAVAITTAGSFDSLSWTGEVTGTITDAGVGQCTVTVSVRREFDGWYWNGVAWQVAGFQYRLPVCGAWRVTLSDSVLQAGMYRIEARGYDRLGNASATPAVSSFSFADAEKPLPPINVAARALTCSTIVVSWTASASADADSISINADLAGFPASALHGAFTRKISHSRTSDTLGGLPAGSGRVYVRTFVADLSGNWSDTGSGASVIVVMPDCLPPDNTLTVAMRSVGDSAVAVSITTVPAPESGLSMLIGQGGSHESALTTVKSLPFGDITVASGSIRAPGWWFVTATVVDSAGNRSMMKFDSVYINNTPPRISIVADSLTTEDTLWVAGVVVSDFNGDSVTCSIVSAPQTATLDGKRIVWTPVDADVGKRSIVVAATDVRGGIAVDTFELIIVNREEPPVILFEGDSSANEGQRWRGRFTVTDPDPQDSAALSMNRKPAWAVAGGDTVAGTPSENDIGVDTLRCIAVDRTGLRDTLLRLITVNNVNDTPAILGSTLPASVPEKQRMTATVTVADEDRIDTLRLFWVVPSTWLGAKAPVRDTTTRKWTIVFEGTPTQRDTGSNVFVLKFLDGAGAVALLRDTVVVLDADDPPSKPVITRHAAAGAVEYRVAAYDDRDTLLTYKATLRPVDDTGWSRMSRSNDGVFRFYPLADGRYLFSASALDAAGLETAPVVDTLTVKGASARISGDTVWEMVSVPAPYETKKLTGTKYLLHWDESVTERQVFHFYQQKSEMALLEPGKSYWRKGSGADTVTLALKQFAVQPVKVPLVNKSSGWNQIASPYPYPVVWRGKSSVLWKWNAAAGDFEQSDSVLEPWSGYWVQSDVTDSVLIDTVPVFTAGRLAKQKKTWFSGLHNWVMQAVLTTGSGRDAENRFGVTPEAKDGYDPLDRPEPPYMEERVSLYFPHGDWKNGITSFATDFRKKWEPVNVFEIGISGSSRRETAAIRFEGYTSDLPIYLFMTDGDTIVGVKPGHDVTIRVGDDETYRTLFVADNPDVMRRLPLRFSMGNAYPNPFCPSTRIAYVLPYRWNKDGKMITQEYLVSIDIYDIMGRQLRNLVYRKMAAGSYEVYWDGKNGSGRVVASGHYYCRLKADKFESIRNLTVVR